MIKRKIFVISLVVLPLVACSKGNVGTEKKKENLDKQILGHYIPKEKTKDYRRLRIKYHTAEKIYEILFDVPYPSGAVDIYGDDYTIKCKETENECEFYNAKTKKLKYVIKLVNENTVQILQDNAPWDPEIPKVKAEAIFTRDSDLPYEQK